MIGDWIIKVMAAEPPLLKYFPRIRKHDMPDSHTLASETSQYV